MADPTLAGHDHEQARRPFVDERSTSPSTSSTSSTVVSPSAPHAVDYAPSPSAESEKPETFQSSTSRPSAPRSESCAQSVLSTLRSRRPLPAFTHPLSDQKTTPDVIVDFEGPDDPYNPLNWPFRKKVITTMLYALTTMGAAFASSVYSPCLDQVSEDFGVNSEVSALGTALLLYGFGLGPLLWAPLSELYGRKSAVIAPYFIAAMFSFGTGAAKDIQTILITRFFVGFFGSAPVTNTGGVLGDIWAAPARGVAIVFYGFAVFGGPTIGPIVGGAVVQSYLRWRWTQYLTGILMLFLIVVDVVFLDETYKPVLLVYKARRLRLATGNWALHARHEEWDVSLREMARKYLIRPFQMIATPICCLVAIYASFVYGLLYAHLAAFPVVYQEQRGWNPLVGALPFLSLLLGIFLGGAANISNNQRYYVRRFEQNNHKPVPEARLPPMMVGSVLFAAGLFIFGWTAAPHIHWIAPNIGSFFVGVGFMTIFQAAINYLVDTFHKYAASAIAANTALRSLLAGSFPLFMTPMLHATGVQWGMSVFGFIAVALIPIPYLFFVFGKRIRAKGEFSRDSTK